MRNNRRLFNMMLSSKRNKFIAYNFVTMNNNSSRHNSINATIFRFRVHDISITLYVIIQLNLNHFAAEKLFMNIVLYNQLRFALVLQNSQYFCTLMPTNNEGIWSRFGFVATAIKVVISCVLESAATPSHATFFAFIYRRRHTYLSRENDLT